MPYTDVNTPMYYPEDYDYSIYYQNELKKYSAYQTSSQSGAAEPNYLNERKCPIYVHHINNDSSVYNNYNQKLVTPRRTVVDSQKYAPQHGSKFVLDKLEETYWATWKPKKLIDSISSLKTPKREERKASKKESNRPHGDVSESVIKYFKAKHFDSTSTTEVKSQKKIEAPKSKESVREKKTRPSNSRSISIAKQNPISQEIQTEVHCPVILEKPEEVEVAETSKEDVDEDKKPKAKVKKLPRKADSSEEKAFVELKDSIEIAKRKQEKADPKEHFKQPKCIRLYRKSGLAAGYIKGGTYPLKSPLKKEAGPKGNFRLGAPGSPLFITSSSFSNKRRK